MLQHECDHIEVNKLFNKFIKLEDIADCQQDSVNYLINLHLFVIGADECHIFLWENANLNNSGYHFSELTVF